MSTRLSSVGHICMHINAPARGIGRHGITSVQHPEKTIAEMLEEVYEETGECSMLHCYQKRK